MFLDDGLIAFDFYMPMYNWFFPYNRQSVEEISYQNQNWKDNGFGIFQEYGNDARNRSLYFHIPFCQDICAFCPFYREVLTSGELLDEYVNALIKEINIKASYPNVNQIPISSIFFGGGTPSILKPQHIQAIGKAIRENFDLSTLKEFSFEMNAKTVTPDRVVALKEIGVTHARMGVQTFNPKYRSIFKLSATLEQIVTGAELLNKSFPFVCVDMLYGLHGQTIEDFLKDLHFAVSLKTRTIDVYPINNMVIQERLYKEYKENGLLPLSGVTKFSMNVLLNEFMRNNGYLPHNGHGYVKISPDTNNPRPVITEDYTFQYHETVYGYKGHEVIGFGRSASSLLDGCYIMNCGDTLKYIHDLHYSNKLSMDIEVYSPDLCEQRGIVLHLPYHGVAEKNKIDFSFINDDMRKRIDELKINGLIVESEHEYRLTQKGWYWYVNMIFYLSPIKDKQKMLEEIKRIEEKDRLFLGKWGIDLNYES